jgi:hypothetical protein
LRNKEWIKINNLFILRSFFSWTYYSDMYYIIYV